MCSTVEAAELGPLLRAETTVRLALTALTYRRVAAPERSSGKQLLSPNADFHQSHTAACPTPVGSRDFFVTALPAIIMTILSRSVNGLLMLIVLNRCHQGRHEGARR